MRPCARANQSASILGQADHMVPAGAGIVYGNETSGIVLSSCLHFGWHTKMEQEARGCANVQPISVSFSFSLFFAGRMSWPPFVCLFEGKLYDGTGG